MIHGELLVDNFSGGGGTSTGIELATGYSVDIAINHDPEAIRMHKANYRNISMRLSMTGKNLKSARMRMICR